MAWLDVIKQLIASPVAAHGPTQNAIQQAQGDYPWLKRFGDIALTSGNGPFESESYMPKNPENPTPGRYGVQLRSAREKSDPTGWPALLGREGVDWLARTDPAYKKVAYLFKQSMTPEQLKRSHQRFAKEQAEYPPERKVSFDDWLHEAELQEYIGAYLVPELDPSGELQKEFGLTPEQKSLLDVLKQHLTK